MAGTLVITTLSDGTNSTSATNCIQGSAKAWVNFDGTGTVAIRASYNVSSITDNGTGDYTVNFTNALVDANYSVAGALGGTTIQAIDIGNLATVAPTTTTFRFLSRGTTTGNPTDATYANISIFR